MRPTVSVFPRIGVSSVNASPFHTYSDTDQIVIRSRVNRTLEGLLL